MPLSPFRRTLPALFFFGGFAWDAVTLGRSIRSADLWILLGYLTGAAVAVVLIGRGVEFRGSSYLHAVVQFLFGGIFSALFIFYFLSSGGVAGYLVVLGLGALLVGNEFLESAYGELTLAWTFFTLCAAMFFNFALAHLFRSIDTFWFYLGTLVAVLLVLVLRQLSKRDAATVGPAVAVAAAMLLLHALNAIPPVPLVKKEMLVAHDLTRNEGAYRARVEPPEWRFWRSSSPLFHRRGGERVYCFTSVFVPPGIETTIRHRWEVYHERRGWTTTSVIPFRIAGGRRGGYRGYTYKEQVPAGRWRVTAESESGAAIGFVEFRVVEGEAGKLRQVRL